MSVAIAVVLGLLALCHSPRAAAQGSVGFLYDAKGQVSVIATEGVTHASPFPQPQFWVWPRYIVDTASDGRAMVQFEPAQPHAPAPPPFPLAPESRFVVPARGGPIELLRGTFHFFSRATGEIHEWVVRDLLGRARKTDYDVIVGEDGIVLVRVNEGELDLHLRGRAEPAMSLGAQKAARYHLDTGVLESFAYFDLKFENAAQTFLYYPGVLHVDDLAGDTAMESSLRRSWTAYASGDLAEAMEAFGRDRPFEEGTTEALYAGYLSLGLGRHDEARRRAAAIPASNQRLSVLAGALETVIDAVQGKVASSRRVPETATGWLAESYYQQSRSDRPTVPARWEAGVYPSAAEPLKRARQAARRAVELAPGFGFAWVRLAQIELAFGNLAEAEAALASAPASHSHNAAAETLQGFLLLAKGRTELARAAFLRARALDPGLADAALGMGLAVWRSRRLDAAPTPSASRPVPGATNVVAAREAVGTSDAALEWWEAAAAAEPSRSLLRSYLGKAYFEATPGWRSDPRMSSNALSQLEFASRLDTNDPTPYLYRGIIRHQLNRVNDAVDDLETSRRLNQGRHPFRSRLLLDQDRSVRSVNLAAVYAAAHLEEPALRAATDALADDPSNAAAHLFLANAYNALRDARLADVRYEPAVVSEYLLATLLAPVGASALSPRVSQQEYGRLLDRPRLGFTSDSRYRADGDWVFSGVQYGIEQNFAYALEGFYRSETGFAPNTDLEQRLVSLQTQWQLSGRDSLYFQVTDDALEAGDTRRHLEAGAASRTLRTQVRQSPNLFVGFHREWSPEHHTLFLASMLRSDLEQRDAAARFDTLLTDGHGSITNTLAAACAEVGVPNCDLFALAHGSRFEVFGAEWQQLWVASHGSWVGGVRVQSGDVSTQQSMRFRGPGFLSVRFPDPSAGADYEDEFLRASGYLYHSWRVARTVTVDSGLAFDQMRLPRGSDEVPARPGSRSVSAVSPKAGLVWEPAESITLRAGYAPSLAGYQQEGSVRLEPSQIAGFNQALRSAVPESVNGSRPGTRIHLASLAADGSWSDASLSSDLGLHWGLSLERLWSADDFEQTYLEGQVSDTFSAREYPGWFEYREMSLSAYLAARLGAAWTVGWRYRVADADSLSRVEEAAAVGALGSEADVSATLHHLRSFAAWNHESGLFARVESGLWIQDQRDGVGRHEAFNQVDLEVGCRFARRRVEVALGFANLTDAGYRVHPVNLMPNLPQERQLFVRLQFGL